MPRSKTQINRDDVVRLFLKGQSSFKSTSSNKWSIENNSLLYSGHPIANKNPVTLEVIKQSKETLEQVFNGSALAAVVRVNTEMELYNVVNTEGRILAKNLAWFDALRVKKSLNTVGLGLVPALY